MGRWLSHTLAKCDWLSFPHQGGALAQRVKHALSKLEAQILGISVKASHDDVSQKQEDSGGSLASHST